MSSSPSSSTVAVGIDLGSYNARVATFDDHSNQPVCAHGVWTYASIFSAKVSLSPSVERTPEWIGTLANDLPAMVSGHLQA